MKDPAFLFYSSDFLTGVSDLTFEERGQYITLLCLQHQKGRLTRKMISIATPNATADVLAKFQKDESGRFYNIRLENEAKKRAEHSEKQRERAIKGWKKRRSNTDATASTTANATALPLEDENVIDNRNIDRSGDKKEPKFNFKKELSKLVINQKLVDEWMKVRKVKRCVNTKTAFAGFIREADNTDWTIDEILTKCVEKSWGGFEAKWIEEETKNKISYGKSNKRDEEVKNIIALAESGSKFREAS